MNTKMLLAILASAVAAFLLGWLIFGTLLMGYYDANMIHYEGLMKPEAEMNLGLVFLGNLLIAVLITWVCSRTGSTSLGSGFLTGLIIGALVYASIDIMFLAMMNMFANTTIILVDILANAVWTGAIGAVAGLVLGSGKKTP
jgi:hypothetical protein